MIFGTGAPRFTRGANVIDLDHASIIDARWAVPDRLERKSAVTGKRNFIRLGDYSEFTVQIELHRYTVTLNGYTPQSKLEQIYLYYKNSYEVKFQPHRDEPAIQNESGADVDFIITDFIIQYIDGTVNNLDRLILTFKSVDYTDMTGHI